MSKDDIEKGNQLYYNEQHDTSCCSRCCGEFCQHPFTLLDVNGYVIDVQRSFAAKPIYIVLPLKLLALGITIDVMARDIMNYDATISFYLAYFTNWTLVFTLIYFLLSSLLSVLPLGPQPSPEDNRAPFMVCLTWAVYPLAIISQTLNFFSYWTLIYWDLGSGSKVERLSYFTLMKGWGLLMILIAEGQFVNKIPLRWSHLTIAECGLIAYIVWTMLHDATDFGNPDRTDDWDDDSIYSFLNWKGDTNLQLASLGCFITMAIILPAVWFVHYVFSWPCRRYMPIDNKGDESDEENDEENEEGSDNDRRNVEMPDELRIPIVAGQKLGLNFATSFPPRVEKISDVSQLADCGVVIGMVVDTLELKDGTVYCEMETGELVGHLKRTKEDDGRFITFINPKVRSLTPKPPNFPDALRNEPPAEEGPDEVMVALPVGSIGVVLTGTPPRVTRISENSAIGGQIRENLVVDTLMLEDGTTRYNLDSTELVSLLKENAHSDGRIIRFINYDVLPLTEDPNKADRGMFTALDERQDEEDGVMVIHLPAGSIGLVFNKATPPMITKIKDTSPLLDSGLQVGMCVDTLTIADTGNTFYQMETKEFTSYLKAHRELEGGRIVRFISEGMPVSEPPEEEEIAIFGEIEEEMQDEIELGLPSGSAGIMVEGKPPIITKISGESPLVGTGVIVGMAVDTLTLGDGTMLCDMDADELKTVLKESSYSEDRVIRFINIATTALTVAQGEEEQPEDGLMPDEVTATIPPGPVGIKLTANTPPEITGMSEASPLHEFGVVVGMIADTLTLEDGTMLYEMDGPELTSALKENADSAERTIRFINPETMEMTHAPLVEEEREQQEEPEEEGESGMYIGPDEIEMVVPPGSIRVAFMGQPPTISKIAPDSPCAEEGVVVGMMVDTVTIDGQVYYELDTPALTSLLKSNADSDDRGIRFVAPHYIVTPPPIPQHISIGSGSASVAGGSVAGRSIRSRVSHMSRGSAASRSKATHRSKATTRSKATARSKATTRSKTSNKVSLPSKKSSIAEEEMTDNDNAVLQSLLEMGFQEETIMETINHFKSEGEVVDADTCMTRIITQ